MLDSGLVAGGLENGEENGRKMNKKNELIFEGVKFTP